MKLVFASNFLNHHQLPLCLEFARLLGDGFSFLAMESIPSERLSLGYQDMSSHYPWHIDCHSHPRGRELAGEIVRQADVFLMSSAPEVLA